MSPLLIILVCLLLSAFFSGSEIAFVSANKLKIELERKQNKASGKLLGYFLDHSDFFIATMLVGNTISLVVYALQMAILLDPLARDLFSVEFWVLISETIIATGIILITAEFLPKTLFRLQPNKMMSALALPLWIFLIVLSPITWLSVKISHLLLTYVFKAQSPEGDNNRIFSRIDLATLMIDNNGDSSDEDEVDHDMKLFQNALDFGEVRLKECMIPRTEIVSVSVDDPVDVLRQRFIETGYSRILVYESHMDNLIGYVHHSDLFSKPDHIKPLVRPVEAVPESMPANKLLTQLLDQQKNVVIVVDEFGGIAGLVTVEDVLEEIFGEIEDEHDKVDWEEVLVRDNEFRFSARHEIDYLNEKYHLNLPESDDFETLAGLLLSHNETIPRVGEVIRIGQFEFTILKASNIRIESVRLTVHK